ncbi:MAG: hypothetical protein ChlgKO_08450 [Chlamydiales bacterium]
MNILIGFPTDTVYGIGAAFSQLDLIQKIYTIKGRSYEKPLIAHVSSIEMALSLMEEPSAEFYRLAEDFWPGALTLVVKKNASVPDSITSGLPTIGIRIPDCKATLELINKLGEPLIGTSANLSGQPCTYSHKEAKAALGDQVDFYVEGTSKLFCASTVYSVVEGRVLREGPIKCLPAALQKP